MDMRQIKERAISKLLFLQTIAEKTANVNSGSHWMMRQPRPKLSQKFSLNYTRIAFNRKEVARRSLIRFWMAQAIFQRA